MVNPLLGAASERDDRKIRTLQASATLTLKLGKGWTFRSTNGTRYQNTRRDLFYGPNSIIGRRQGINGRVRYTEAGSFSTSNVLSYDRRFKKIHHVTFQLGQEFVKRWTQYMEAGVQNLPTDDFLLNDMSLGTPSTVSSSYNDDDKLISFFGRLGYDYDSRYIFTATFRADGSSKFGKNNKWGYFPAVSGAWRISDEAFMDDLEWLSDLKLRAGYGLAGNNRIGSYNSLALMNSILTAVGDGTVPGYAATQIPNPDLKWESNKTFNLGLDMGFFNQRLTISPEFYINRSNNLLLNAQLPYSSGYQTMLINAGSTKNVGVDISINSVNISNRNFQWTSTLTLTHNKNTVTQLVGGDRQLYEAKYGNNINTHLLEVGSPIGQFYGWSLPGRRLRLQPPHQDLHPQRRHTLPRQQGADQARPLEVCRHRRQRHRGRGRPYRHRPGRSQALRRFQQPAQLARLRPERVPHFQPRQRRVQRHQGQGHPYR